MPNYGFIRNPLLTGYAHRRIRELEDTLSYRSDRLVDTRTGEPYQIDVPANVSTDLASVPRLLWSVLAPCDVARAAIVHDYLYHRLWWDRHHHGEDRFWPLRRKLADQIFLDAMRWCDPPPPIWIRRACYRAVRLFGAREIRKAPAPEAVGKHVADLLPIDHENRPLIGPKSLSHGRNGPPPHTS